MDQQTTEEALIRETIQTYFDALHESSGEKVKASFHARGTVSGIMSDSGAMAEMDTPRFVAFADANTSPAENGEPREDDLISIEVTGKVASVKLRVRYLGKRFTDHLLLIKDGGRWQILNKVWHADPT
jgi:hypothetical protein